MGEPYSNDHHNAGTINSEDKYKALFEKSNDAIFLLNTSGEHLEINKKATELLGYFEDEIRDMS